jgi:1-deoxy-D-xylulose-5-phosphate reductoisomerase
MGPQVTCDSATLMNKGLELIEAHHLFGLPYDRLEVLVHPQSVVHALVEYIDGTQSALLGPADMRLAIAYALSHPRRWPLLPGPESPGLAGLSPLDLPGLSGGKLSGGQGEPGSLTFEPPDRETFPALGLAEAAGREGGTAPVVLISANEEAVRLFLEGRLGFLDIPRLVRRTLEALPAEPLTSLEQVMAVSGEARRLALSLAGLGPGAPGPHSRPGG